MPIKGITDKKVLPRLGKIRLGIKKTAKSGKEYPDETEYFVLNPLEEILDKAGNVTGTRENEYIKKLIAELETDKPHEIEIALPVDDLSLVADPYMKWWAGNVKKKKSTLRCKGDGEYATYKGQDSVEGLNDPSIPEHIKEKGFNRVCNKDSCPQAVSGLCKPNMNFMFVIPGCSLFGVFQIDTTSFQAMQAILSSLDVARNALKLKGITSLAGVPLMLYRERRDNTHGGVNYIMKVRVKEARLEEEIKLLQERKASTLALSGVNYEIEMPVLEEPNYDLLPKSTHGRAQTGELEPPSEATVSDADLETWITDSEADQRFKALGDLKGIEVTKAKKLATARKFQNKDGLLAYLNQQLAAGQPDQAKASA